jgi:hypothetical protein
MASGGNDFQFTIEDFKRFQELQRIADAAKDTNPLAGQFAATQVPKTGKGADSVYDTAAAFETLGRRQGAAAAAALRGGAPVQDLFSQYFKQPQPQQQQQQPVFGRDIGGFGQPGGAESIIDRFYRENGIQRQRFPGAEGAARVEGLAEAEMGITLAERELAANLFYKYIREGVAGISDQAILANLYGVQLATAMAGTSYNGNFTVAVGEKQAEAFRRIAARAMNQVNQLMGRDRTPGDTNKTALSAIANIIVGYSGAHLRAIEAKLGPKSMVKRMEAIPECKAVLDTIDGQYRFATIAMMPTPFQGHWQHATSLYIRLRASEKGAKNG